MINGALAGIPRVLFAAAQLIYMNPFFTPIWALGLVFLFSAAGKPYRILGWLFVVVFGILLARHGKPYYLSAAYPVLFAAGSVWLEQWTDRKRNPRLRWGLGAGVAMGGIALAPFSLPLLPLRMTETVVSYIVFGVVEPEALTGDFRRQLGWPEYLDQLAAMAERVDASESGEGELAILSNNYSLASAVSFLDDGRRLPRAYSGHMSWYFWGPPPNSVTQVLAHGYDPALLEQAFESVREVGRLQYAMGGEAQGFGPATVYLCRGLRKSWAESWPLFRRFDHNR